MKINVLNTRKTWMSPLSVILSVCFCVLTGNCQAGEKPGVVQIYSEATPGIVKIQSGVMPANYQDEIDLDEPLFANDENDDFGVDFAERTEFKESVVEPETKFFADVAEHLFEAITHPIEPMADCFEYILCSEHEKIKTNLTANAIGIQSIPSRPNLLVETNESFLGPGTLSPGFEIFTGAIWRPSLWVFGQYRTGITYQDNRVSDEIFETNNRLDLFGQLNLSGTERILLGVRPLDQERATGRRFTGVDFRNGEWIDGANPRIQTLFFEGDFGEIFPDIDLEDSEALDVGFSVGRQPLSIQQGLLINEDMIDAATVTRNTISGTGNLNMRITKVFAWDKINRNNNQWDEDALLMGLFTESDFLESTINADIAYVDSSTADFGSLVAFGLSAIRRFHGHENTYNSSSHVLASFPTEGETAVSGRGVLLFQQLSWTVHKTEDLVYLNGFYAIDQFTSPARGRLAGGPLGQTGILFAAAGLGQSGAPLSNQADNAAGGSLGYQMFFDDSKEQVVVELGARQGTKKNESGAAGIAGRYQKALDQHWIFLIDTFLTKTEGLNVAPGIRFEFLAKF